MATLRNVRVMISTFNAGNAKAEGFENLVPPSGGDNDILVFGMQESTYFTHKDKNQSGKVKEIMAFFK